MLRRPSTRTGAGTGAGTRLKGRLGAVFVRYDISACTRGFLLRMSARGVFSSNIYGTIVEPSE